MPLSSVSGNFDLNGWPIHYEKFGTGSEIVLLIPGALGTGRTDFAKQLEGPDAFNLNRFTFVAVDLPGWGRSRPPKRHYGLEVYNIDVDCCFKLMANLGYKTFSVIGWSDGAKVALKMCHKNPIHVKCSVIISILIEANKQTLGAFQLSRDINIWPKGQLDAYIGVYGNKDTIQLLWDQNLHWIRDAMNMKYATKDNPRQYILKPEELKCIRTPVLIVHGDRDPFVSLDQPLFCKKYVPESTLHRFAEGSHNCHQVFATDFKKIVVNFFDACDNCF